MVEVQQPQKKKGGNLLDHAVLISVKLGKPGFTRKIKDGVNGLKDATGNAPRIDGDHDYIRVSKKLLDSGEFTAIGKFDTEIRGYIYRQCLPSMAIEGVYILPHVTVKETVAALEEMRETRRNLIDQFLAVYDTQVQEAAEHLGSNYDPNDYDTLEQVADQFNMEWRLVTLGVPDALADIDPELHEAEKQKAHQQVVEMQSGICDRLRATFRTHIDSMIMRLDGERAEGKPRIFRNSLIENAVAFLQQYKRAFADLVEDADLSRLIDQALDCLTEISPDDLRQSKELRENVVEGLREVQSALDALGVRPAKDQEVVAA
jgi:hypothetical protein